MPKAKRNLPPAPPIITHGHIRVDRDHATVHLGDEPIHLTPKEAQLLWTLMVHAHKVLTRAELMQKVWNTDFIEDTRTLEVHLHWLRKKIEPHPTHPVYLRTIRGEGYMFEPPAPSADQP
jgi:DNA-binding response OmpR family regulator